MTYKTWVDILRHVKRPYGLSNWDCLLLHSFSDMLISHGTWNGIHVAVPKVLLYMCDNYVMSFLIASKTAWVLYIKSTWEHYYLYLQAPSSRLHKTQKNGFNKALYSGSNAGILFGLTFKSDYPSRNTHVKKTEKENLCVPLHDHCLRSNRLMAIHHHRFADLKFPRFTSI